MSKSHKRTPAEAIASTKDPDPEGLTEAELAALTAKILAAPKPTFGNFTLASSNVERADFAALSNRETYVSRRDRQETALAYLERVWGRKIRACEIFLAELRKVDPSVIEGVKYQCKKEGREYRQFLPPTNRQKTDLAAAGKLAVASIEADRAKARAKVALRNRAYRARLQA